MKLERARVYEIPDLVEVARGAIRVLNPYDTSERRFTKADAAVKSHDPSLLHA